MKKADAEAEMAVLEKLVKATDHVRAKYRALQKGKQDDEKVLSDMFKPVVSPLNKIVERIAPSEREREPQVDLLARMRQSLSKPEQDIHYCYGRTYINFRIGGKGQQTSRCKVSTRSERVGRRFRLSRGRRSRTIDGSTLTPVSARIIRWEAKKLHL